jgi:hypothetical protein
MPLFRQRGRAALAAIDHTQGVRHRRAEMPQVIRRKQDLPAASYHVFDDSHAPAVHVRAFVAATGSPEKCDSIVTAGIPPISIPASTSVPEGISRASSRATSASSRGSASSRHLSK